MRSAAAFAAFTAGDVATGMARVGDAFKSLGTIIMDAVGGLVRGVFGGGVAVAQSFANGLLQAGVNIVRQAAQFLADMVANFLGHSMPTEGALVNVEQGGISVGEKWAQGLDSSLNATIVPAIEKANTSMQKLGSHAHDGPGQCRAGRPPPAT
jgi:hypothetical protein